MSNPAYAAQGLASFGRHGDDTLVHMNRHELRALEALHPRGRLSTNPHTGLPEAFDLGSALGIVGAIGGMLAAPFTGGMSMALTGALGAGLGTFGGDLIMGKDFGNSLLGGIGSGLLSYGGSSLLGGIAGAGAGDAMSPGQEVVNQLAQNGVASTPLATAATAAPSVTDQAMLDAGLSLDGAGAGFNVPATATPGGLTGAIPANGQMPAYNYNPSANLYSSPPSVPGVNYGGVNSGSVLDNTTAMFSNAGKNLASDPLGSLWSGVKAGALPIAGGLYAGALSDQGAYGSGMYGPPTTNPNVHNYPTVPGPNQRKYTPPPPGWDYSTGKEWNYFSPAFADGGIVPRSPYSDPSGGGLDWRRFMSSARFLDDRFMDRVASDDADFASQSMAGLQADERDQPEGKDLSSDNPFERRDTPMVRFAKGGKVKAARLVATNRWRKFATGGAVDGPGGGLDDAIPAIINGRQPAKLSSGEYVIPAHAVSALGNGSTQEGVRQLDGMVSNVMQQKYGTPDRKPNPINPRAALGLRGG